MNLCRNAARRAWIILVGGLLSGWLSQADAAPERFQDLTVDVVGEGRPVLMIPGLNSAADTWWQTCEALQADRVQCHVVQLPGFAGAPAVTGDAFLEPMRDRLLAYVKAKKLVKPAVVGHSLGGVLALQMAIVEPQALGPLVIVDSLPYMAAVRDPSMTPERARPMAEGMRQQMRGLDDAAYAQGAEAAMRGMTVDAQRVETLRAWGRASDRHATSQAMYDMMVTDLRPHLGAIRSPTLVLGSWAAYKPFGSTKESTEAIFRTQFATLDGVRVEMSEAGYHFLMWDDPTWVQSNIRGFLAANPQPR